METNHYGIAVDSNIPIMGVFQNNHCEWLYEDTDSGTSLGWHEHLEDCAEEDHDYCDVPFEDALIGFMETNNKDNSWYWFPNQQIGFKPDDNAEYSAIVGEIYTQVVRSKYFIKCELCSPCYPGQGDADTPGEYLCYSLPTEVIGEYFPEVRDRVFIKD